MADLGIDQLGAPPHTTRGAAHRGIAGQVSPERQLLRAVIDALVDPQILFEPVRDRRGRVNDFTYREVNTATCDYLGVERAELVGQSLVATFPRVVDSGLLAAYARHAQNGEPLIRDDFPFDVLGRPRRFDIRGARMQNGWLSVNYRDVTERFDALQREAALDVRYRRLMDNSIVATSLTTPGGRFVLANPAMCDLLGYDAATLLTMRWQDVTPAESLDADLKNARELAAGRLANYRATKRLRHADGHELWVDLLATCFRNADGSVQNFIIQIVDVTAENQAREQLERSRAILAASADSMLDPQILLEAVRDGSGRVVDFRYVSVNRATCLYLGVGEHDLVGRSGLDDLPNLEGSGLLARYAQCLTDGEPVILSDFDYFNEMLEDARRYDIRATRAGPDLLSLTWSDVTERYTDTRRLAQSEERYRLLAENAGDLVTHVRDGRFVWVSPNVGTVLGGLPEYWIGRPTREMVPPEDVAAQAARIAILEAGGTLKERIRVMSLCGERHWVHVHAKPYFAADGRQDGFTGSLRLVDDEVAAEQERDDARRQQARADTLYRRSMDSAAVAMCLCDLEGTFIEVNEALCRFFGYDAATLAGLTWQELTAADYLQADLDYRARVLAGEIESYRMVKRFIHADGSAIWGDLFVSCLRAEDGQVETFIGQITDLTAEIRAREQLEEARRQQARADQLFRRSVDSAAIGMCLIDPAGGFIDVNDALCRFFGYDAETLKTKTWQELTAPEFLGADLSNVEDVLQGRMDTYRMLKQYVHADGHLIWGDLAVGCVRTPDGAVENFISQITDVTAEVETRRQLVQRDEQYRALAQRLTSEMRSAADYVASTLPDDLHGPVEVSSRYLPSLEVGGDSLSYRWIDDDLLKFYLIDVSGHGIKPALLSMSVHNLIRSGSLPTTTLLRPDRLLSRLNSMFRMEDQAGSYFTMWYGIYESSTRTLRYASAGHPPVLAFNPAGADVNQKDWEATALTTDSPPCGLFDDATFRSATYTVPVGCRMLLFSDGAFDLVLPDGRQWTLNGFTEMAARVAASDDFSADAVVDELRGRTVDGTFEDDCSLIALEFD